MTGARGHVLRWIRGGGTHPYLAMALDETLSPEPTTLRTYRFEPPALSIGYFQSAADFDPAFLEREGLVLVRRPTGGAAIDHRGDLTFSVVGRKGCFPFEGGALEAYRTVHAIVAEGLALLGVRARERGGEAAGAPRAADPVCFRAPASFDLMAGGRKIVGSAQRRRGERILLHGSVPIEPNRLAREAASLADLLGRVPAFDEVEEAIGRAFARAFGGRVREEGVTPEEEARARSLAASRFATDAWNRRR